MRRDSDLTVGDTDTEFSTDDESLALYRHAAVVTSTTSDDTDVTASCSCSRRSSYGVPDLCQCLQCTAGRIAVVTTLKGGVSASAPASRRSSAGQAASSVIKTSSAATNTVAVTLTPAVTASPQLSSSETVKSGNNRHKEFTKPKDVKFKRISKAKSRSLEELRDKLRHNPAAALPGSASSYYSPTTGIRSLFDSCSGASSCAEADSCLEEVNSLTLLRGYLEKDDVESLDLELFQSSEGEKNKSLSGKSHEKDTAEIGEPETITTKC